MKKLSCILLIDDNEADNFFHSLKIKEANITYHIRKATTGERAIAYLSRAKLDLEKYPSPDLIFLDINMPGMNGFEFLEKAIEKKLIAKDNPVVIIMLTSSLNPNDEKLAKEKFSKEIKGFKNKPLTVEMLIEIVEKYF